MSLFYWSSSSQNIKNFNKHAIIDLIRFTPGGITRIELARKLDLTRAAITTIVADLQSAGLVREVKPGVTANRKAIVLEMEPASGYVIGVDIGASHVTALLADFSAYIVAEVECMIDITDGPQLVMGKVAGLIRSLTKDKIQTGDLKCIGVGLPGPVIADTGEFSEPTMLSSWNKFPIEKYLSDQLRIPVCIANDADLGAIGEWAYGAGRGEQNLVYIKVGSGIGAGIFVDGQIYHGATGAAGEIGHVSIDMDGPLCSCGNRGCLQTLAGGNAVAQQAILKVQQGERTQLAAITPTASITSEDVVEAASNGDLIAQQILSQAGYYLGTAIAGMVNFINPDVVIIGGNVSKIGDLLLDPIRKTVWQRSLKMTLAKLRISAALLGKRSSAMGAVVLALNLAIHSQIN